MAPIQPTLSRTFTNFFESGKSSAIVLIVCTAVSLVIANSGAGAAYSDFWHAEVAGLNVEQWVNDGLMAVFFLFVGLELERELYNGELSSFRSALLPIFAAVGGVVVPASIHFGLNAGTPTQAGAGIPMATDIAFALGVLALLGDRVPASLKVHLTALAVADDLCAVIVIAAVYTAALSVPYLLAAGLAFGVLVVLNRVFRIMAVTPYLLGGAAMWFFMLKSGVHATVAGVLLAFAIPFSARSDDQRSPSHRMEHYLQRPVAFIVLPLFALANTGIVIQTEWQEDLRSANSMGIIAGLLLGKPVGIVSATAIGVAIGACRLPPDIGWRHIVGAGLLGGIGFTMSIFITLLAFAGQGSLIDSSRIAILVASVLAGLLGFVWLRLSADRRAGSGPR